MKILIKMRKTKMKIENEIRFYQCLFQLISTKWFEQNFKVKDFADIWCLDIEKFETCEEYFNEFKACLFCVADRMNLNRWLYLQTCINKAFDLVYSELTKEEFDKYVKECGWEDNYKNKMMIKAENWFEKNFKKLYKKVEES